MTQAAIVVDELVRVGVRDAVLCPGSRNAPLSFALHQADKDGRLRLHVRIDERTAAFLALGLALRSRRAVPVVCTSGTAAVNLHPAMVEAAHADVPLLAVTADRPIEAQGTGASQTIDQLGLYAGAVRASAQLAVADPARPEQPAHWRSTVDRTVAAALGTLSGHPGPVQLNVPFREPLTPDDGDLLAGPATGRADDMPWSDVRPCARQLAPLPLDPAAPTLVIAGHGGGHPVPTAVPVLAEPTSALWWRTRRGGSLLLDRVLADPEPGLLPEQVVVLGRPTLHRPVQRLLAAPAVRVYVVPPDGVSPVWTDVPGSALAVGALPRNWCPATEFGDRWREVETLVDTALDRALRELPIGTGPALAAAVTAALPAGALLFAGPSNPIRDLALAARPRPDLTVLSNRGTAGIDGVLSSAIGAALRHDGPGYALLGDLTFLHDITALVTGPAEPVPDLTVVVANDDGGSIFSLLEQGAPRHATAFERVFGTAHHTDLGALCAAFGIPHHRVEDPGALRTALHPRPGIRVVEVPVRRADRRDLHARLTGVAAAALDGGPVLR